MARQSQVGILIEHSLCDGTSLLKDLYVMDEVGDVQFRYPALHGAHQITGAT